MDASWQALLTHQKKDGESRFLAAVAVNESQVRKAYETIRRHTPSLIVGLPR